MLKRRVQEERELPSVDAAPITSSVIPAIDAIVAEIAVREVLSGSEIVDRLLDLRLLAVADEVFANCR